MMRTKFSLKIFLSISLIISAVSMQVSAETTQVPTLTTTPTSAPSVPATSTVITTPAPTAVVNAVIEGDATLAREANEALSVKDYGTAINKFTTLAQHGNTIAQFNVGVFYLNGQGVPKDEKLGYGWIKKAALGGKESAKKVLENGAASGNQIAIAELKELQQTTPGLQLATAHVVSATPAASAVAPAIAPPVVAAPVVKKASVAQKTTRERLVLMPMRVGDDDTSALGSMETALVQGLKEKYEVFSGEQVAQKAREIFLKESRATSATRKNCDETRCMQDIAEAFQAELIATSNVTRRVDGYLLALSIQNIFDNKVVFSNSIACRNCDIYQVIDKLKELSGSVARVQVAETSFKDCPDCPEMALIPQGTFEMGDAKGNKAQLPVHRVTIAKAFGLSKTEITQRQWKILMGSNPSEFKECGENCPVEKVSWADAQEFIKKLNAKTGKQYRLPSEAEWEYACRAGVNEAYCGSDNPADIAWYGAGKSVSKDANSLIPPGKNAKITKPVATKQANAFGLFDMSGNVWEWVQDSAHDDYSGAPTDGTAWDGSDDFRILRGGSWYHDAEYLRTSVRGKFKSNSRNGSFGFRVALSLQAKGGNASAKTAAAQ